MFRQLTLAATLCLAAAAHADTIVVQQVNFSFSPSDVTINVGDTVRWERTSGSHTVTEGTDGMFNGNEAFHSSLNGGTPVFEFTFDAAFLAANPRPNNKYDYFCVPHFSFGMTGTVTVNDQPGTSYCECPAANASCNNPGGSGEGCANSSGAGGVLSASGSTSVAADDLAFHATGLLPNQPALLFSGTTRVNGGNGLTFGDGLRCAGGSIKRLGVSVPNAAGEANWGPGLAAGGAWMAGDTRRFQAWYRDPAGPCGSGFNLSNAYEVVFN